MSESEHIAHPNQQQNLAPNASPQSNNTQNAPKTPLNQSSQQIPQINVHIPNMSQPFAKKTAIANQSLINEQFSVLSFPGILVIFGVILVLMILWKALKPKSKIRTRIVLIGQRYSGKTQLFQSINEGKRFPTVPSIKNNVSSLKLNGKKYEFLDYCGDHFSKDEIVTNIGEVHTLVHVVDGTDGTKLPQVAAFMYKVLVNIEFQKQPTNYILFLNKEDSPDFLGAEKLEKKIEDQIQHIKSSRKNQDLERENQQDYLKMSKSRFGIKKSDIHIVIGSAEKDIKALQMQLDSF